MTRRRFTVTRREVLLTGAGLALAGCPKPSTTPDAGPRWLDPQPYDNATRVAFAPAAVALSRTLFPQTVSSGAMRPDSALLWTRAEGATSVTLRVWRDLGSESDVALVKELPVTVPAHGAVKVPVAGLAPATWYRYAFFSTDLSARSPIGQVRTAFPDDWEEPLTVGATSCAKAVYAPYTSLSMLAARKPDLWLHVGDVSYNDGSRNLDEYRAKYRQSFADPGYRDAFEAAGVYVTWDDHEFENNFDFEAAGPTNALFLAARQAFYESLPAEPGPDERLWRSYRWGRTAEFFVLDCRTERKPSTRETPQAQYLGRAQMDWLKAGLKDSPCHFKVLLNSVPISDMPPPLWGGQAERWQGYPAAREELLGFIDANGVKNAWFVSGDFHLGLVLRVERGTLRSRLLEVVAGPAAHINPLALVLEPGPEANRAIAFPPEQVLFASGGFNATTLTFDPKADTVRVVFDQVQAGGQTYDATLREGF